MSSQTFRVFELLTQLGQDGGRDVYIIRVKDRRNEAVLVIGEAAVENFIRQLVAGSKLFWDHLEAKKNPHALHPSRLLGTACVHCGEHIASLPHLCPPQRSN